MFSCVSCRLYKSFFFSSIPQFVMCSFTCLFTQQLIQLDGQFFFMHSCLLSTCSFLSLLRYKIQVSFCNNTSLYLVSLGELIVSTTIFFLTEMQELAITIDHSSRCIPSPTPKEWYLPSKCKRRQWHFLLVDACAFFSLQYTQYLVSTS